MAAELRKPLEPASTAPRPETHVTAVTGLPSASAPPGSRFGRIAGGDLVCRPDRSDKTATWSTEARAVGGNNSQSLETKERRLSSKPPAREQEEYNGHAQQEED